MIALLVLNGIFFTTLAQVLLKIGMQRFGAFEINAGTLWTVALQAATSWEIVLGIFCYGISLINWLIMLSRLDISFAYPMMSIGYVATALCAYFYLGEQLGPMRIAGTLVIMLGVWMISRTA